VRNTARRSASGRSLPPEINISGALFGGFFGQLDIGISRRNAAHGAAHAKEKPMDQRMAAKGAEAPSTAPAGNDFLEEFISEEAYAARRGVSIRTCQRDRQLRQSPPFVLIGRQVYYRVAAIKEWLRARERSDERTPTAPRGRGRR
jgi:hypothetical protein